MEEWKDPLRRQAKDHREISEYLESLNYLLGVVLNEDAWIKIKPIERFLQRSVVSHFESEENTIFAPFLLRRPTLGNVGLILGLQREHGMMLKELEGFHRVVSSPARWRRNAGRE